MKINADVLSNASDDELNLFVAESRGCTIGKSITGYFCSCHGSPHGTPAQKTPMGVVFMPARIHKFPKDVAIGYLKGAHGINVENVDVSEGVPLVRILMGAHGELSVHTAIPIDKRSFELLMAIRGSLTTLQEDFRDAVKSMKKSGFEKSNLKDEISKLLGEDDEEETEM